MDEGGSNSDEDLKMSAATLRNLARIHKRLMDLVARPPEPPDVFQFPPFGGDSTPRNSPTYVHTDHAESLLSLRRRIRDAVGDLANRLDARWQVKHSLGGFSLGQFDLQRSRRAFLRGHVDLLQRHSVYRRLPDKVAFCLLSIHGISDQLVRENHGNWGYHYHYIHSKRRRSDTLLTFEHQPSPNGPVLMWERHAEGGKFKAKAGTRGPEKQQSVYTACLPGTSRWTLSVFKKPDSSAVPVWP